MTSNLKFFTSGDFEEQIPITKDIITSAKNECAFVLAVYFIIFDTLISKFIQK